MIKTLQHLKKQYIIKTEREAARYKFIYPWKFRTKQIFSPWICITPIGNSKAKNQDHWKLYLVFSWSPFYSFLTNLWKFYLLIPSLSLTISGKSHYYCDRYKLIHLQLLFLSALFPSINQLLGSKTLSHMVLVCNGWKWGDFKHLNSTFYLTIWLSDYGCCSLDRLKWNWALINARNNSSLDVKHSMTGKAFCLKENWKWLNMSKKY